MVEAFRDSVGLKMYSILFARFWQTIDKVQKHEWHIRRYIEEGPYADTFAGQPLEDSRQIVLADHEKGLKQFKVTLAKTITARKQLYEYYHSVRSLPRPHLCR